VSLSVLVLIAPLAPIRWPLWLSPTAPLDVSDTLTVHYGFPLLLLAGVAGCAVGLLVTVNRSWARPANVGLRFVQDMLAYDFYLEKGYELTVVWLVSTSAKVTTWFDRYVVDGLVNVVGFATVLSGQALRYSASGKSQGYILTITVSLGILFALTMMWMG